MTTFEKLQQHLAAPRITTYGDGFQHKEVAPLVRCTDGTSMSVQASEHAYCSPRTNIGPYTKVEVWRCGEVPAWAEYGDGEEPYAYLPIELVVEEIDRRGGFAN